MPPPDSRPSIKSSRVPSSHIDSRQNENQGYEYNTARPAVNRATTFEGPTQIRRDISPLPDQRISRVPSDNLTVRAQRSQLRPLTRGVPENDLFSDPSDDPIFASSPDRSHKERSASPATSIGSAPSRSTSYSTLDAARNGGKQPPPPPPSRSKKPPPPPPMKRSALSTTNISYA